MQSEDQQFNSLANMKGFCRIIPACVSLLIFASYCWSQQSPSALRKYIHAADSSFHHSKSNVVKTAEGTFYDLNFVSQTWQNIIWNHQLIIYIPEKAKYKNTLLLLLRHYDKNAGFVTLKTISDSTHTACAVIYDIPNQPLFDGKEEDDLQAYTFSQYIKSGDASWPLLFPMVKAVVRGMDVIQELAMTENKSPVDKFIIAGHSKRGHTAWLTAAVDSRVKGIIPIAIHVLNATAQLPHHLESFGEYSTPSKAATDFLKELNHPRGKDLIHMIDPYSYKDNLTIPKLIVSGTNDELFPTDALNLYWKGLRGSSWILSLSNANHVSAYGDQRMNNTAFAFVRAIATNTLLPPVSWKFSTKKDQVHLEISTDKSATSANVWTSASAGKDFRRSKWTPGSMQKKIAGKENDSLTNVYEIDIQKPSKGFIAIFGEIQYIRDGCTFLLSTQTHIYGQQ